MTRVIKVLQRVGLALGTLLVAAVVVTLPLGTKTVEAATWGTGMVYDVVYFAHENLTETTGNDRDILTDGYCVHINIYYAGSWHVVADSTSCTNVEHMWLIDKPGFVDITAIRLVRDDGRYQTLWTGHTRRAA